MTVNIPVEIYETDYVLLNSQRLSGSDVIYSAESVIDLFNEGFRLESNEKFVKMTDLPKDVLLNYAKEIAYNQTKN